MDHYKPVSLEEYVNFIMAYGKKKLTIDYPGIFPIISYNDFSDGKVWPESIVAYEKVDEIGNLPTEYFIRK